jgi:predicted Zn-dependent protease
MGMIVKALGLRNLGQNPAGITLLEEVVRLYPSSSFGWECLVSLRLAASDFQGAEIAGRMAVDLISPGVGSWGSSLLATALVNLGRCAEALPYAQANVRDDPDTPGYLQVLGDAYWCLDNRAQAIIVYQLLKKRFPGNTPDYIDDRIR